MCTPTSLLSKRGTGGPEWAVWGFLCLSGLIQITVRDRWIWSGLWFYLTPWPVLAGVAWVGWGILRKKRWLGVATLLTGTAMLAGVTSRSGPVPDGAWHIRLWNAGNPMRDYGNLTRDLLQGEPDLLVLTDSGVYGSWLAAHPDQTNGYDLLTPGGGFTVIAHPELEARFDRWVSTEERHTRMGWVELAETSLLLVELDYRPWRSKHKDFGQLMEAVRRRPDALFLAGDFNVPRTSHWALELTREGWVAAFERVGEGWSGSWPGWMPVYGLTQIRTRAEGAEFHRAIHGDRMGSDHRPMDIWATIR